MLYYLLGIHENGDDKHARILSKRGRHVDLDIYSETIHLFIWRETTSLNIHDMWYQRCNEEEISYEMSIVRWAGGVNYKKDILVKNI